MTAPVQADAAAIPGIAAGQAYKAHLSAALNCRNSVFPADQGRGVDLAKVAVWAIARS